MPEPTYLSRSRALSALSSTASLLVIQGNRFSGKSTLLRTWCRTEPTPGAIVICVDAPVEVCTAEEYWAAVVSSARAYAGIERPDSELEAFEELSLALTAVDRPMVLILDGVENVEPIEEQVAELLNRFPKLSVIVTTRTHGAWTELVGLSSDRMLVPLSSLPVTDNEISTYLRAGSVPQNLRTVQWINRRTRGLPVLIDAVREYLQDTRRTSDSGVDRLDELIDTAVDGVVLQTLDDPALAPLRREILASSATSAVTNSPATALSTTASFVRILAAAGIVDLDAQPGATTDPHHGVWRYPQPVRTALRRLAEHEYPDDVDANDTALIRSLLDRRDFRAALTQAIKSRYWEWALEIIDEHWTMLYTGGSLGTLGAALIERIPSEIAESNPTVSAIIRLERQFAAPRNMPAVFVEPDALADVPLEPAETIMHTIALRIDGRFTEAAAVCDAAASQPLPEFEELGEHIRHAYGFYYLHIGITYLLVGRADEAITMFRHAHRAGAGTFVERDAAGKLALIYAMKGACPDAQLWIDEEHRHPPLTGNGEKLVRTAGCVASALVALDRLEPDAALDILTDLGAPADNEELWAFALYAHGRHTLLTGMPADGLRYIDAEILRYRRLLGEGISAVLVDAARADLHLACGNFEQADALVGGSTHPLTAPVRARIHLLTAHPAGAEAIVHSYIHDPKATFRISTELAVLGAAAESRMGHPAETRRHLTRAAMLSRRTGLLQPFVLLPAPILEDLASLDVDLPTDLRRIASRFLVFPIYRPTVDLTARERAVLDALVAGSTTASIAAAEFVSVNTVKSQIRSLYRKLGVHSRKEAVTAARRLFHT